MQKRHDPLVVHGKQIRIKPSILPPPPRDKPVPCLSIFDKIMAIRYNVPQHRSSTRNRRDDVGLWDYKQWAEAILDQTSNHTVGSRREKC